MSKEAMETICNPEINAAILAERKQCAKLAYQAAFKCMLLYNKALGTHGLPFVHNEVFSAILEGRALLKVQP